MNIYVANVPYTVKDQDLQELFAPFGEVTSAKIIMDKAANRNPDEMKKAGVIRANSTDIV